MVSQPLDSSPMAGKSPQPSHGPPFQAPVTLKQDETVEGDIKEGVGGHSTPLHANTTATETAPFDTPGCDEANTFHVSLTIDRRKLLGSWTTSLLKLVDCYTAKLENRYTARLVDCFTAKLVVCFTASALSLRTASLLGPLHR